MKKINHLITVLAIATLISCTPKVSSVMEHQAALLPVDGFNETDSLAEATIAPFRVLLKSQMDEVIGQAAKRLEVSPIESPLGNFVADALLTQSRVIYTGTIHMSVSNNSGLRAPIPQGPIKISTLFELMPFENLLYILELNGKQTRALFDLLAADKQLSIANTVVFVGEDKPTRIFIDGSPFREDGSYVLAVSDYLAQGGAGMDFLREAKVLAKFDVKIRDMIIDQVKWLTQQGSAIDAEIEGRVKLIQ